MRRNGYLTVASLLALSGLAACDGSSPTDAGVDAGATDPDTGVPEADGGVDGGPPPVDAGPPCEGPPGLYIEGSCEIVAEGVRPYRTAYTLWADDADKERYIFLPAGSTITTTDADNWVFPVGTRVYKTFLLDGVRLETRLLEKTDISTGVDGWTMRAWAWNEAQDRVTEVTAEPEGSPVLEDVLGTDHDIPSANECRQCHSGSLDVLNGFSAIQLNHDGPGVTLQRLVDGEERATLSDPPTVADAVVPGTGDVQEALGYMHANCGHCHRYTRYDVPAGTDGRRCDDGDTRCGTCSTINMPLRACSTGLRMRVRVSDTTPEETDTYATAVGVRGLGFIRPGVAECRITPGDPDASTIYVRTENRGDPLVQMPPIATEQAHADGLALLEAFIEGLPVGTGCPPAPGG